MNIEKFKKKFNDNKEQILNDFFTFLKFESISSLPEYKNEIQSCIHWLKNYVEEMGFETEIWEGKGHPILYAHYLKAGINQPTLLIYNHYDVQPVDPLNLWKSSPFSPTIKDGNIYARGAQDNKGQCFYTLQALKALFEEEGSLPINIKLCIEGEEECGSHALSSILPSKKEELKADYLAIVDLGIRSLEKPSLTLGIRGIITMDVEVKGTNHDMHSGSMGGLLYNPNHALVEILSKLRDETGKITVPGFYDDVTILSSKEKDLISWDFDESYYVKTFGAKATGGESHYQPLERNWIRPTLEINGINGGYSGEGFKTVIPAIATAKISCRLVPNQNPLKIAHLVKDYLESLAPEGITVKVSLHEGGGKAMHSNPKSKIVQAFKKAYDHVLNANSDFVFEGASIPIVPELQKISDTEVALVGLGLDTDCIHAPNEHFSINRLEKGYLIMIDAISNLRT